MTEKWGEIQGKLDLVRVGGEFKLSGFYGIFLFFGIVINVNVHEKGRLQVR